MFKKIDFTKIGGFPFTQDTLGFMQSAYEDLADMITRSYNLPSVGKYIVSGAVVTGSDITAGWLVVDGLLMPLQAGTGTHIELVEVITPVNYNDGNTHPSIVTKFARPTNTSTGNIPLGDFLRISLVVQDPGETISLTQITVGDFDCAFQKIGNIVFVTIEAGWVTANGANFVDVPAKYRPASDKTISINYKPSGGTHYNESSRLVITSAGSIYVETPADSEPFDKELTFSYML